MTLHPVTGEQARHLRTAMTTLRDEFALDLLHMLRHLELPPLKILRRQFAVDPVMPLSPIMLVVRRLFGRSAT